MSILMKKEAFCLSLQQRPLFMFHLLQTVNATFFSFCLIFGDFLKKFFSPTLSFHIL